MNKLKRRMNITIEKTNTGYSAYANDLPVFTTAQTIPVLYENLIEAFNLHYQDSNFFVTNDNLRLHLDLQQFFQYYKVLNAKFLAQRIGMNATLLSQYVRGIKKPSAKQTHRIIEGIQTIGKELADINLV